MSVWCMIWEMYSVEWNKLDRKQALHRYAFNMTSLPVQSVYIYIYIVQKHTNIYKHIQTCTDIFRDKQKYTDIFVKISCLEYWYTEAEGGHPFLLWISYTLLWSFPKLSNSTLQFSKNIPIPTLFLSFDGIFNNKNPIAPP